MSKYTAIDWFLEQIENKNGKEFSSYYSEFVEPAMKMEKEQVANAYAQGCRDTYGIENPHPNHDDKVAGEYYYNATYGGYNFKYGFIV